MENYFWKILQEPNPIRTAAIKVIQALEVGNYPFRIKLEAVERPHYGYCVYHAGWLAKKLGLSKISLIEFGVAGGSGLKTLEYHAENTSKALDIEFEIYGFDTGGGLPPPEGYQDLPYHWREGFYKMDQDKIKKQLKSSQLIIGDVKNTIPTFIKEHNPAPIGALFLDLDFYSSTNSALKLLEENEAKFLPRTFCYFDDVLGGEIELYNDFTGQRLSINNFNSKHNHVKLGKAYHLLTKKIIQRWYHQIWIAHFFKHTDYTKFISEDNQQLKL